MRTLNVRIVTAAVSDFDGPLQMIVRDALKAQGINIVWSQTSAACEECLGRGYSLVGTRIAPDVWGSTSCTACDGTGRPKPTGVFP